MNKSKRIPLYELMLQKELVGSRKELESLVLAGKVLIGTDRVSSEAMLVGVDTEVRIEQSEPFVSRGGHKLKAALDRFQVNVKNKVCADVGASTGGFTDVLLQEGASKVYAIDVGYGELAYELRKDPRVVVMERTNARKLEILPEKINFACVDVSFISLRLILPQVKNWFLDDANDGHIIVLFKPQFEAPKELVEKGGLITNPKVHTNLLREFISWLPSQGLYPWGLIRSPIEGAKGNREFLVWVRREEAMQFDVEKNIAEHTA